MHKANTLLEAFVDLVTGLATTGQNVETTRGYPTSETPAITVRLSSVDPVAVISNAFLDSYVELETVYHVASAESDLDAKVLQIDAEVYAAIMADPTIGGAAIDTDAQALTIESSADTETPTAAGLRRWRCRLRHSFTSAEA